MADNPLARQLLDFQKQVVEFQKSAFDNTFDAMVALQDQQRELMNRLVEQAPGLPAEAKEAIESWAESLTRARDEFKTTTDRSFELLERYLDRLEGGEADGGE